MFEADRAVCHLTDCRLALHSRVVVVAAQNDGTSTLHFRSHTPLQLKRGFAQLKRVSHLIQKVTLFLVQP